MPNIRGILTPCPTCHWRDNNAMPNQYRGIVTRDPKDTRGEKHCFLIGQNKTKCVNFHGNPLFFEAAYNTKINILLISCQLDAWIRALASKLAVNCVSDLLECL